MVSTHANMLNIQQHFIICPDLHEEFSLPLGYRTAVILSEQSKNLKNNSPTIFAIKILRNKLMHHFGA